MNKLIADINRWDQPDIPHKDWRCVDVIDHEKPSETCQMCGNERIRFVHVMLHSQYSGSLAVGCVCAEKMSNDYVNPRRRETLLRNKAARRERWLSRKWKLSRNGNFWLKIDGHHIIVFRSKFVRDRWGFGVDGNFSSSKYGSVDEAKLASFDAFWVELNR
jgi:hypothetical protein